MFKILGHLRYMYFHTSDKMLLLVFSPRFCYLSYYSVAIYFGYLLNSPSAAVLMHTHSGTSISFPQKLVLLNVSLLKEWMENVKYF